MTRSEREACALGFTAFVMVFLLPGVAELGKGHPKHGFFLIALGFLPIVLSFLRALFWVLGRTPGATDPASQ